MFLFYGRGRIESIEAPSENVMGKSIIGGGSHPRLGIALTRGRRYAGIMKPFPAATIIAGTILFGALSTRAGDGSMVFRGMCDASAAVSLDLDHVLVANDEDNFLRVYSIREPGAAVQTIALDPMLRLERGARETDLEGAARLGERVYWISSHGRNKNGKSRPNRHQFFATTVERRKGDAAWSVSLSGKPYHNLLRDLLSAPQMAEFGLEEASRRAPKAMGGFNIEGLCAMPGGRLLIGFRNPIPGGRALLVPLENPEEVTRGESARFGDPILLDLGGRGVRDLVWSHGTIFIAAGAFDGRDIPKIYRWSGPGNHPEALEEAGIQDLNPEALLETGDGGKILALSDDGGRKVDGEDCKDLPEAARRFRAVWLK